MAQRVIFHVDANSAFLSWSAAYRKLVLQEETDLLLISDNNKGLVIHSALIPAKTSKSTQGVKVMTQKAKHTLVDAKTVEEVGLTNLSYYRTKNIPAVGHLLRQADLPSDQVTLFDE